MCTLVTWTGVIASDELTEGDEVTTSDVTSPPMGGARGLFLAIGATWCMRGYKRREVVIGGERRFYEKRRDHRVISPGVESTLPVLAKMPVLPENSRRRP